MMQDHPLLVSGAIFAGPSMGQRVYDQHPVAAYVGFMNGTDIVLGIEGVEFDDIKG